MKCFCRCRLDIRCCVYIVLLSSSSANRWDVLNFIYRVRPSLAIVVVRERAFLLARGSWCLMAMSILMTWSCSPTGDSILDFTQVGHRCSLLCAFDVGFIRGLTNHLSVRHSRTSIGSHTVPGIVITFPAPCTFVSPASMALSDRITPSSYSAPRGMLEGLKCFRFSECCLWAREKSSRPTCPRMYSKVFRCTERFSGGLQRCRLHGSGPVDPSAVRIMIQLLVISPLNLMSW
jgi:hypothetical protein